MLTTSSVRLWVERERVQRERDRAAEASELVIDLFDVSDPDRARGEKITAREVLDRNAGRIASRLADRPLLQADLRATIGRVYRKLGLYSEAADHLQAAVALRRDALGPRHLSVAQAQVLLGDLQGEVGDHGEAAASFRQALTIVDENEDTETAASAHSGLATAMLVSGDYDHAEALHRQAVAMAERLFGETGPVLASSLDAQAGLLRERGNFTEAEQAYRRASRIYRTLYGENHPEVAALLNNLALVLGAQGRHVEAETALRAALVAQERIFEGPHRRQATTLHNLASSLRKQGRLEESERLAGEALTMRRQVYSGGHVEVAETLSLLGLLHKAHGSPAAAEEYLPRGRLGGDHPDTGLVAKSLASLLLERRRFGEAESVARDAVAVLEAGLAADHTLTLDARTVLGASLGGQGRFAEAEELLVEGHRLLVAAQGPAATVSRRALQRLIVLYESWPRPELAERCREQLRAVESDGELRS